MEVRKIYLYVGIYMLFSPPALAGMLGRATNVDRNSHEADIEARLLSRLMEAEKQKMVAPEPLEMDLREEKETVEKFNDDRTKIDISVGGELVERHIRDCKTRYEIIMMKDGVRHKRPRTCYLRKMDDKLYSSACFGNKTRLDQKFTITDEIVNKDFLTKDGPDNVCRDIPMFKTENINDVDDNTISSRRGLNARKRSTCHTECGLQCRGWWDCPWVCDESCN